MQVLRKIGFPISLVYALVVYVRNFGYNTGLFRSTSFTTPTLCIGNLSVGGTGKTPMIEFLISRLQDTYKLAILSRGYKRKSNGFVLADGSRGVEDLGDEPFQVYSKFPGVTVAVDADRRNGIQILEEKIKPELILLDDAFQHRKVKCGFSILLTSYSNLYVDDWYLPTGNLRDSVGEAKRADIIVVTKCPENLDEIDQNRIRKKLTPKAHQKVLFSALQYDTLLKGNQKVFGLSELKGKSVCVVTGIANAQPLITFLTKEGLEVEHLNYADHHFFTDKEIGLFNTKEIILTTEKDFVRLKNKVNNVVYIGIEHYFLGDGENQLLSSLEDFMP